MQLPRPSQASLVRESVIRGCPASGRWLVPGPGRDVVSVRWVLRVTFRHGRHRGEGAAQVVSNLFERPLGTTRCGMQRLLRPRPRVSGSGRHRALGQQPLSSFRQQIDQNSVQLHSETHPRCRAIPSKSRTRSSQRFTKRRCWAALQSIPGTC
jgi:hypothetical protein